MPSTRHLYPADRLVSYSDAVFSIALTLLVLDIRMPEGPGTILGRLLAVWPSLLSLLLSFVVITVVWFNHHEMFQHIRRVDHRLIFWNTALMLSIILIPFTASILGRNLMAPGREPAIGCFIYGMWLSLGGIPFNLLWRHASSDRAFLTEDVDEAHLSRLRKYYAVGPFAYAAVAALAFLSVWASFAGFLLLMAGYFLPPELFRRKPALNP